MQASGLPGPIRLVIPEWSNPPHAFVEFRGNGYGSTTGIGTGACTNPTWALITVADEAQDSIMETLWETCPHVPHPPTRRPRPGARRHSRLAVQRQRRPHHRPHRQLGTNPCLSIRRRKNLAWNRYAFASPS